MKVKNILPKMNESILKVFSDRKMVVENYHFMDELSDDKIVLRDYIIEGKKLIVKRMDGFLIEIEGDIDKITLV